MVVALELPNITENQEPIRVLTIDEVILILGPIYVAKEGFVPIPMSDAEFKKQNPGYQIVLNQG